MTNYIFDATHPLDPEDPLAAFRLVLSDAGTAVIDLDVVSAAKSALQAAADQRILVLANGTIQGALDAIVLQGSLYNVVSNEGEIIAGSGVAIKGGAGADRIFNKGTITTTTGAAVIDLGAGHDLYDGTGGSAVGGLIQLGIGNDTALGGGGSETFSGGMGDDYVDGGTGADTVDYSDLPASASTGVSVNLSLTGAQLTNHGTDTLVNIENVIGSAKADLLTGSSALGSAGDNRLDGGAGNDTLDGGLGNDSLEGGDGEDTAKFSGSTAATVNLSLIVAQATGYGMDTLTSIENLTGDFGADKFIGNEVANTLKGNSGDDTLEGGGGNDTLEGGNGLDLLKGGAGNDSIDGGAGDDTAVFAGASGDYEITRNPNGTVTVKHKDNGPDGIDTLTSIRFAEFSDKTIALVNGAPTSFFPSSASIAEDKAAGTTVTTFFAADDPDGDPVTYSLVSDPSGLFAVRDGKIILAGGLNYEVATQHVIKVAASDPYGETFVKDVTVRVTNVTETTPLVKYGTAFGEQVVGESGGDTLYGLDGNDTLFGQIGNDTLFGGAGRDTLLGGTGQDFFVLESKSSKQIDTIYDFDRGETDKIYLPKKVFSKLVKRGTLSKDAFVVGDRVHDAEDRIIYLKKAGALFYDPDGTGAGKAVQIATVTDKPTLKYSDFIVI